MNTLNLLEDLHRWDAPRRAVLTRVECSFLFRATPRPRPGGRPVRSQANRAAAGHSGDRPPDLETLRANSSRLHHILIQGNLCSPAGHEFDAAPETAKTGVT